MCVFERNLAEKPEVHTLASGDRWADVEFADGTKQRVEFYFGSGYLSQSTRKLTVPASVKEFIVHDYKGDSRKVPVGGM